MFVARLQEFPQLLVVVVEVGEVLTPTQLRSKTGEMEAEALELSLRFAFQAKQRGECVAGRDLQRFVSILSLTRTPTSRHD